MKAEVVMLMALLGMLAMVWPLLLYGHNLMKEQDREE